MGTSNEGQRISMFAADGSVSAYQILTVSGANQVDTWQTNSALILGVAENNASVTNDAISVVINGVAKVRCGASVSAGGILTGQTETGKCVAATITDNTTTSVVPKILGIALEAGSTNAVIAVALGIININKQASA